MKKIIINTAYMIIVMSILMGCNKKNDQYEEIKMYPVKVGDVYQYIDREGEIVINPQFSEASIFRDGIALVLTSGDNPKWGFIGPDGKYLINPQYKKATVFSEGLAWVVPENSPPLAIDKDGNIKFKLQDAENVKIFKEGLAAFSIIDDKGEQKWGFVDKTGKVKINPQFWKVGYFSEGLCAVSNRDNGFGFIDTEGKLVINYQFDNSDMLFEFGFKNNRCIVYADEIAGVIDKNGKYLINPQFDVMYADGNSFLIEQDGKWGWCDAEGKIIINPQFETALPFAGHKMAAVESGEKFGYIDQDGKILVNPQFDEAYPFNGKLAVVISSGKVGLVDPSGRFVVNPQFDGISEDVILYLTMGMSDFSSVETDFFNANAIVSVINLNQPEGFSFNSTFKQIMEKYDTSETMFNKRWNEHLVYQQKRISKDASYGFYILGQAYQSVRVQKGSGWYTYNETEYRFAPTNKPTGFAYIISLSGKGVGKEQAIVENLFKKYPGIKKDSERSSEGIQYYTSKDHAIEIRTEDGGIVILLTQGSGGIEEMDPDYEEHPGDISYEEEVIEDNK